MGAAPAVDGRPTAARPGLAVLSAASALSPFGMAIIVPVLPLVIRQFDVDYAAAQFLISAYLFGLGIGQPVAGVLCDRIGRRPVLLSGIALFAIASALATLADNLPLLTALRFTQALGISVGTVATRAIVRDTHDATDAARAISRIAAAMGIAPIVAPMAGGLLGGSFGLGGVFGATGSMAVVVWFWLWRTLPETRPPSIEASRAGHWRVDCATLARSRVFVAYTLLYATIQGGFFVFMPVGASVFETELGLDQRAFGLAWGAMAVAYVLGAVLTGRLLARLEAQAVLRGGATTAAVAGLALLTLTSSFGVSPATLLAPLFAMMVAGGIVTPLAMAGAVNHRPEMAGTASGLSSALALALSGGFAVLSGFIFSGRFTPIALVMAGTGLATAALVPATRERDA